VDRDAGAARVSAPAEPSTLAAAVKSVDRIRIGDMTMTRNEAQATARGYALIEAARDASIPINCLCNGDHAPVPVYSRRLGSQFVLCRMPDSGLTHAEHCVFHGETTHSQNAGTLLQKRGDTNGERDAIIERPDGKIDVRIAIPLKLSSERKPAPAQKTRPTNRRPPSPPRQSIDLTGLLRFVWECAGFNRWYPAMAGKRRWPTLMYFLTKSLQPIVLNGVSLADRLLLVNPLSKWDRRSASIVEQFCTSHKLTKEDVFLVAGAVRGLRPDVFRLRLVIHGMPEAVWLDDSQWRRIRDEVRDIDAVLSRGETDKLVVLAAVTRNDKGYLHMIAAGFMSVTSDFLPYINNNEALLIRALVAQQRRFTIASKPSHSTVKVALLDTAERFTPLTIIPAGGVDYAGPGAWRWLVKEGDIPPLPEKTGALHV